MSGSTIFVLAFACFFLALLVYFIFHNVAYKNFQKKAKLYGYQRYGFYECGFRPRNEVSISFDFQNYIVFSMTILYDSEGVILMIFCQTLNIFSFVDFALVSVYFGLFFLGIMVDIRHRGMVWQYY